MLFQRTLRLPKSIGNGNTFKGLTLAIRKTPYFKICEALGSVARKSCGVSSDIKLYQQGITRESRVI